MSINILLLCSEGVNNTEATQCPWFIYIVKLCNLHPLLSEVVQSPSPA